MQEDIGINLKLRLSHIQIIMAALNEVSFKHAAPIINALTNQVQDQLDRNAAMAEMFEGNEEPETPIEQRRAKAKAKAAE